MYTLQSRDDTGGEKERTAEYSLEKRTTAEQNGGNENTWRIASKSGVEPCARRRRGVALLYVSRTLLI